MSRQSQDLYTSVHTAHNKIDKLDKRISKLEGGIVASADALADLEYRHLHRLTALEREQDDDALRQDKRLTALEGDGEDNAEVIQGHELRLTALEHDTFEHDARLEAIETVQGEALKPKPLSCCEGCADFPCTRSEISGSLVENSLSKLHPKPSCYREKHTCGECVRPFWNEAYGNGWCFAGKQLPVDRDDEACADFIEAIQ